MSSCRIADAPAREVGSHLRLLAAAAAVHPAATRLALEAFDRVRAMTRRLLDPV
jgi:hypothetical protein